MTIALSAIVGFGGSIASGSTFPGSPATNQFFNRTDIGGGMLFFYDGARWVSEQLFNLELGMIQGTYPQPLTATTGDFTARAFPPLPGTDIYLLTYRATVFVNGGGSALSGSNKWVGDTHKYNSSATPTTIATTTINSGASSTVRTFDTTINALLTSSTFNLIESSWTKTGTPGGLFVWESITYRVVAT